VDELAFAAALLSALTYAGWNAAARRRPDPGQGFAIVVIAAGFVAFPGLLIFGFPNTAALPWMLGGMVFNLVSMRAIMATYRRTPFAVGFPIARGLTPPLVALAAMAFGGEALSMSAVVGIVAVSGSLLVLGLHALDRRKAQPSGLALAALSSVFAAGYVYMDAAGARASGSVLAYGCTLAVANAITLAALGALEGRSPLRFTTAEWRFGFLASIVSMASYLLLLFAFTRAPMGPVSAIRETSVLFATALAAWLLKEKVGPVEWLAAAVAVLGIAFIRLS
jgi:drug/metabolite transporter (DMT)-like permease